MVCKGTFFFLTGGATAALVHEITLSDSFYGYFVPRSSICSALWWERLKRLVSRIRKEVVYNREWQENTGRECLKPYFSLIHQETNFLLFFFFFFLPMSGTICAHFVLVQREMDCDALKNTSRWNLLKVKPSRLRLSLTCKKKKPQWLKNNAFHQSACFHLALN